MRKLFLLALILVFSVSILIADELHVGENQDYSTIQSAVDDADYGDEIIIHHGTYYENVNLDNSDIGILEIRSVDPLDPFVVEQTVIQPSITSQPTFVRSTSSQGTQITLRGLTISGGLTAISIHDIFISTEFFIYNCDITDNNEGLMTSCAFPVHIFNSIFYNNSNCGVRSTHNWSADRQCIQIENSLLYSNGTGLLTDLDMYINHCTIADNTDIGVDIGNSFNGTSTISNSIIYGNDVQIDCSSGTLIVEYSDIEDGHNGTGNIDADPLFINPNNENYELRWDSDAISPCIDSGNPSQVDNDGTPSDMGCFPAMEHDYHKVVANSSRIRWRSFPVVDRDIVDEGEEAEYVLAPVEEQTDYFNLQYFNYNNEWYNGEWSIDLPILISTQGYKIRTSYDVEIPVPGTKQADDTVMQLEEGYNWLGYFLEEPMGVADAFAPIWDKFVNCASEDWFVAKVGGIPPERCSLIYGKLYIVKVNEDCSFIWGQSGGSIEPRERTMTEAFTYEETYDYTPIVIESLDDLDIEEVGVFLNDECIGAAQVEEFPLQILAFVPEENRGEYTFQFYTGDRNYVEKRNFKVYDERLNQYITKELDLMPYELTYVSFDNNEVVYPFKLMANYPNPFNPETTIQYSLPEDSPVELAVYNIKGQRVKILVNEIQLKGIHEIEWDGKDASDKPVNSGIYLYKLTCEGKTDIKKMTLLK
ncbi:MAG: hypothetical protein APR54_07565 [Candidatus Cloacimonas sp. SDB]|nr:MAG: hypothetical protein APR54_07565 [Candidatus Cloacimonas sp. SDB]